MSTPRYGSAAAQTSETVAERAAPMTAQQRLDAQNAGPWSTWAAGVDGQLANISGWIRYLAGDDKDGPHGLVGLLAVEAVILAREETAETIKTVTDALTARIEAETATLHDEFIEQLDKTLLAHSPKKLEKLAADLRAEADRQAEATAARLETLAERIDVTDKRRRGDRNTAHREYSDLVAKLVAIAEGRSARLEKRVEEMAEELKGLRAVLIEQEILAPDPLPLLPLLRSE